MSGPAVLKAEINRDQGQNWDRGRQHDVGEQDREIDGPDTRGTNELHAADVIVIHQVADEKYDRDAEGRKHCVAVRLLFLDFDLEPTDDQQDRGQAIQHGIDGRELFNGEVHFGWS